MAKNVSVVTMMVIFLTGALCAQDAKSVLNDAARAIGADKLQAIEYTGTAATASLGQAGTPNGPWPMFNLTNYSATIDFAAQALRATGQREQVLPVRGGGGQPIANGPFNENITLGPNSPWSQQLEFLLTPFGFLRAATAAGEATVETEKIAGKRYRVISFFSQTKAPSGVAYEVKGYIDDQNLIETVETWLENPVLGDMQVEAGFSEYKDFGGIKVPTSIIDRQGGHPVFTLKAANVIPNPSNAQQLLQAPAGGPRGGGPRAGMPPGAGPFPGGPPGGARGGPQASAPARKLGEGVYLITGGYRGIAVEFKDYVVVIEGAQNETRAEAVIAETKKLIPGKPIRYAVNTHHHFDHAQGLRAFVAEGATIITHQSNKSFYEKAYNTPRTLLAPDSMTKSGKKARFLTVGEKKVLKDGTNVLELYHIKSPHDDGMLIAYLPKLKLIVESDLVNGPPRPNPFELHLASELERLKLDYVAFVPAHQPNPDQEVPKGELLRRVAEAAQHKQ
jgi:glyoxylase-like metal-dependent hydrolase (beta-lactamase superfamily II)